MRFQFGLTEQEHHGLPDSPPSSATKFMIDRYRML